MQLHWYTSCFRCTLYAKAEFTSGNVLMFVWHQIKLTLHFSAWKAKLLPPHAISWNCRVCRNKNPTHSIYKDDFLNVLFTVLLSLFLQLYTSYQAFSFDFIFLESLLAWSVMIYILRMFFLPMFCTIKWLITLCNKIWISLCNTD